MPLAGRMKLKWFVLFVGAFVIAGIAALVSTCKKNEPPPRPHIVETEPPPSTPPTPSPPTPTPPTSQGSATQPAQTAGDLAPRAWDSDVLAWRTKSISGDKVKDASKGQSYKINLYKDAGSSTVNRAKVDINRDDKWDEKYTFEGDKVTLQRAPADDEKYTETYHWTGTGWAKQ